MAENAYTVTGMTCGHCEMSVREEIEEISGVSNVAVDHTTGSLTFDSEQPVAREDVQKAVEEAGYSLA